MPDPEEEFGRIKQRLSTAAAADVSDAMVWFELGYGFLTLTTSFVLEEQELETAESAFGRARSANPNCLAAYHGLKLAFNKRSIAGDHKYLEAIDICRDAVARLPDDPEAWFLYGESLTENYDRDLKTEALRAYERAVELDPAHAAAYFKIASIQRIYGNTSSAVAIYRRVIALDGSSTWAKDAKRSIEYMLNDPQEPRYRGGANDVPGNILRLRPSTADIPVEEVGETQSDPDREPEE